MAHKATGFVYHPDCLDHDPGPAHPERPDRVRAVFERVRASGMISDLSAEEPEPADPARITLVHLSRYVSEIEAACARAPARLDPDTAVSSRSYRAALLAAGGVLHAVEQVLEGRWANAFVCCRPPGHHAERARAMGFCLFNSVAIAAADLRRRGIERVAIVDFDVHHGNGTQHLFDEDPTVYYVSLHQWPLYPGTGSAEERGKGAGEGTTLNCPQPPGAGDSEWLDVLDRKAMPELARFRPEFLLLSAGFDGHVRDPLASTRLTEDGYREITRRMMDLASRCASGRIVSVLEGGYDLEALASSVEAHLEELKDPGTG